MRPETLDKLGVYFRTVRHLRPDQILRLTYRRFRPASAPHRRLGAVEVRSHERLCSPIPRPNQSDRSDVLAFVGFEKSIRDAIDWRSAEMSRLWRYNLHYFDFLADQHRTDDWKRSAISNWIDCNPRGTSVAWEPYPMSLRIVNWINFFYQCKPDKVEHRWLKSLYEQVLWLENNLEKHVLANHYLKNAKALAIAGVYFSGADAERWRSTGLKVFRSESSEQFLADGGHFERSPMYHVISLEDVLDVLNYINGDTSLASSALIDHLESNARSALDFLDAILLPDGRIPLFNDSAYGIAPDAEQIFSYANKIVHYERTPPPIELSVRALSASGYYVIRDRGDMLIVDCGPLGPSYQPGHGHCDCLSYELVINNERIVIDTGVHDYEPGPSRQHARSTAAHNTIVVDGCDQSEIWGVFRVGRRASPLGASLTKLSSSEATFAGTHDGYRRLAGGVIHRRSVSYSSGVWRLEDIIEGRGHHSLQSRVHLHPGLAARIVDAGVAIIGRDDRQRAFLSPITASATIELAPVYPAFGVSQEAHVIVMSRQATLPATIGYTLTPSNLAPA